MAAVIRPGRADYYRRTEVNYELKIMNYGVFDLLFFQCFLYSFRYSLADLFRKILLHSRPVFFPCWRSIYPHRFSSFYIKHPCPALLNVKRFSVDRTVSPPVFLRAGLRRISSRSSGSVRTARIATAQGICRRRRKSRGQASSNLFGR